MAEGSSAVDAAIEREIRLLDPEVRSSPRLVGDLLHAEFTEFGASGRVWDREGIIALLAAEAEAEPDARPVTITFTAMKGEQLAPDLVHLTFDTDANGRRAHRSSLWRHTSEGWLLYFHQATLFVPGE
ncbi:nuclear transport factor 2 family protein [Streptomyces sp. NA04227]|uniref:nuclear transport factor 2 family protein n=1 Tax=Streptomyces sp. NA04227 TaxID=2742136 RepID=UPI001590B440|nr:DUF4440 domain-containing protein [Streptomyces sp. NA04227]QKW09963.1 nuclear transport factor 2 family protein [Streptomyces sp. NA04227]